MKSILSPGGILTQTKFVASPNSMKEKILNTVKNSHSVPSEYAHFHVGSGLVKLQMLEVIIGFF